MKALIPYTIPAVNYDDHRCLKHKISHDRTKIDWHDSQLWSDIYFVFFKMEYIKHITEYMQTNWLAVKL
jgi:hypothetical protein